jgi:hypothetical protein
MLHPLLSGKRTSQAVKSVRCRGPERKRSTPQSTQASSQMRAVLSSDAVMGEPGFHAIKPETTSTSVQM